MVRRGEKQATAKAEETRERIVDAALQLFRDRGFDQTTMRDIAAEADVATGAAYYYFRSKEELVMAFYVRTVEQARTLLPAAMAQTNDLRKRLRAIINLKLGQFAEHRRLLIGLARIGIDPDHPLSPFGSETLSMREEGIAEFDAALRGSNVRVPKDLQTDLPRLLWLYQMAIILFWIFDSSPRQARTHRLVDGTLDLIVRLIRLSSLPLMGPLRRRLLHTIRAATI
ncbi:MAG TPA: TetR family transcriptional regulator [Thermoanaerobaculia bacterium]